MFLVLMFRHFRARARLRARRARGEAILKEMRDNWRIVKRYDGVWSKARGGKEVGEFVIVGEMNDTGDRRLRLLSSYNTINQNLDPMKFGGVVMHTARLWKEGVDDEGRG